MFVLHFIPSVANHFLADLRDVHVQKDSMRFRKNLERVGEILAYEISKNMDYVTRSITTPLAGSETKLLKEQPVLVCILRAGLPFYQGFLNFFDEAENAFIGAYRSKTDKNHDFEIEMHYATSPSIEGKTVILIDPMLATGKSLVKTYESLLKVGKPARLHVACVLASQAGVDFISKELPKHELWLGALDKDLNDKFYIVPGLGDAGDLAFGAKL
jgi:uracil phosphoribosyltransferase